MSALIIFGTIPFNDKQSVVFPAPCAPKRATNSPFCTSRETPSSALVSSPAYWTVKFSTLITDTKPLFLKVF